MDPKPDTYCLPKSTAAQSLRQAQDLPLIKMARRNEAVMKLQINLGRFWKLNFRFILSANIC